MTDQSINDIRGGAKVVIDNDPYLVIHNEFVKPGKGQAFNRIRVKNLKNGRVVDKTYKAHDSLTLADIAEIEAQYLYNDGQLWHFMCQETFEQYAFTAKQVGEAQPWLKEQIICVLTLWNNEPLTLAPPIFVTLQVTATEPDLRGDTSGGGSKSATLETGANIRVPLFVTVGDTIKVDTRTATYISRVQE